ncbi:N-methylhydantoinase A/acetone carboxylase, beta subunit [Enterococcus faecalis]|nr:hydantoinase/oxoprolinase family protein [Enterococcus faecalis]VFA75503.1 N-methylhydantoinase A/acetone carboxylase, beta subunit [Enterococcus faecalis]
MYLCQNDGTLMSLTYAKQFPILTIACGPTNSIRGASYLAGLKDAVVFRCCTTSDIGVLVDGFPENLHWPLMLAGYGPILECQISCPIGVGGGSLVREQPDGSVTVGPIVSATVLHKRPLFLAAHN